MNRFLEIAKHDSIETTPLLRIFKDAMPSESADIVEAIYVIGEQRATSGHPVGIQEITTAIGDLVADQVILDAAVDVCMQGLVATGYSQAEAQVMLLDSTSSMKEEIRIRDLQSLSTQSQQIVKSPDLHRMELPRDFGPLDENGRARYELRRLIGRGSQGCVYEATDRKFVESGVPSYVALKIFHGLDKTRSTQEGARTRRIRHRHIARVFDQGQGESNELYVAYEMIDGLTLDLWVNHQRGKISPRQACRMIVAIASGVQSAHNAGIVHRDLKPSNILVTRDDEPIVTDFGISWTMNHHEVISRYGTRGTLAFMAPEQYDGMMDGAMPSSDIYALGGILYWLITSHFPNGDSVDEATDWLDNRCDGGPHRIKQWGVNVRLQAIMNKALSLDPADRYQSVDVFAQDLKGYLENLAIPWLDRTLLAQGMLFAKRSPLVVLFFFAAIVFAGISIGVWVNAKADIREEHLQTIAAIEKGNLENQLALEQARIEELKEKSMLLKTLVQTWSNVLSTSDDSKDIERSLLFLHSVTVNDFVQDDSLLLADLLDQKLEAGEEYLMKLKENSASPLQIAVWHEILGAWNSDTDTIHARGHLLAALKLVEEFGPNDEPWRARLLKNLESMSD